MQFWSTHLRSIDNNRHKKNAKKNSTVWNTPSQTKKIPLFLMINNINCVSFAVVINYFKSMKSFKRSPKKRMSMKTTKELKQTCVFAHTQARVTFVYGEHILHIIYAIIAREKKTHWCVNHSNNRSFWQAKFSNIKFHIIEFNSQKSIYANGTRNNLLLLLYTSTIGMVNWPYPEVIY